MNNRQLPITLAISALLGAALCSAGEIYKWTDDQGNVHYEDRPVGNANLERVDIVTRDTDNSVVQARLDAAREARAAAREAAEDAPPEITRQELREQQEARQQKCEEYRDQLEAMLRSTRLYRESGAGEREYLDEEEILAARERVQNQIDENCGG
jgi:hypothetical protein